jgi:hypothetical protein
MNRDTKKGMKIIGKVNPKIIAIQIEDYCPTEYKVIIINVEFIEEER